jgi:hypothetical protein
MTWLGLGLFFESLVRKKGGSGFGKGTAGDMKLLLEGANGCLLFQVARDDCYCVFFLVEELGKVFFVLVM